MLKTKAELSRALPCHVAVSTCLLVKATLYLKAPERPQWEVDLMGS